MSFSRLLLLDIVGSGSFFNYFTNVLIRVFAGDIILILIEFNSILE